MKHKIWNITLENIFNFYYKKFKYNHDNNNFDINNNFLYYYPFKQYENNKLYWIENHIADFALKTSTKSISNGIPNKEKEFLKKHNYFDLKLYQIAKLIENVDVEFYDKIIIEIMNK